MVNSLAGDFSGEHRAEPVSAEPHRLVANIDPVLGQQVFDVPQRQRVFDIHHHHEADHLGRRVETAERTRWRSSGFAA